MAWVYVVGKIALWVYVVGIALVVGAIFLPLWLLIRHMKRDEESVAGGSWGEQTVEGGDDWGPRSNVPPHDSGSGSGSTTGS